MFCCSCAVPRPGRKILCWQFPRIILIPLLQECCLQAPPSTTAAVGFLLPTSLLCWCQKQKPLPKYPAYIRGLGSADLNFGGIGQSLLLGGKQLKGQIENKQFIANICKNSIYAKRKTQGTKVVVLGILQETSQLPHQTWSCISWVDNHTNGKQYDPFCFHSWLL